MNEWKIKQKTGKKKFGLFENHFIQHISFRDVGQQNTEYCDGKETKESMMDRHAAYNGVRQAHRAEVVTPKRKKQNHGRSRFVLEDKLKWILKNIT